MTSKIYVTREVKGTTRFYATPPGQFHPQLWFQLRSEFRGLGTVYYLDSSSAGSPSFNREQLTEVLGHIITELEKDASL